MNAKVKATKVANNYNAWNVKTGDVVCNSNGKKTATVLRQGMTGNRGNKRWTIEIEITEANFATYTERMTTAQLAHRFPVMPTLVRCEMTLTNLTAEQVEAVKALGMPALTTQIA